MIDPPYAADEYRSTILRAPSKPLLEVPPGAVERTGPVFGEAHVALDDADLTRGGPIGERINVVGRVLDGDGRPVAGTLVEVWQANSAGRYAHAVDDHPAPLDPGFTGAGRCLTGRDGSYSFVTVKPGAYPWGNHPNAWRPAHVHFSVFGRSFSERLVTQMYFPGDPLLAFDPIYNSVRSGRERLVSAFDWDSTEESCALGYRFDLVLSGHLATPVEAP